MSEIKSYNFPDCRKCLSTGVKPESPFCRGCTKHARIHPWDEASKDSAGVFE